MPNHPRLQITMDDVIRALRPIVGAIEAIQKDDARNRHPANINTNAQTPNHSTQPALDVLYETQKPSNPVHSTHELRSSDQSLKANKAFKLILAAKAEPFDGSDCTQYQDWKDSLEREVHGLHLTPAQWMDLLHVRTTKDANAAIQPARILQRETSPREALGIAWRFLDQQFSTSQKPSQQLLDELLKGPTITCSNPTSLTRFSHQCQAAVLLRQSHPGSLSSLDELTTQKDVFYRLDEDLHAEWFKYSCTHLPTDTPSFEDFARWVLAQSKINLRRKDHIPKPFVNTYQAKTSTSKLTSPTSPNQTRRVNPHSSSRNFSGTNTSSQNQWINSSGRYPTGLGKPLHESSRTSSPVKFSPSQDQKKNFCAWCRENRVTHNHDTANCNQIKGANALDQWTVLFRHRICFKCLSSGHYYKECKTSSRCGTCNRDHHKDIGCRPEEIISRFPKRD